MIINDLDGYYIVFDTKNWNTELDTLIVNYIVKLKNGGINEETNVFACFGIYRNNELLRQRF